MTNYEEICKILETPLGYKGYNETIEQERKKITARYDELKVDNGFREASLKARTEWLTQRLERVERENTWSKEKPNYDCILLTKEKFGEEDIYKMWTINDSNGRSWLKTLQDREYLVIKKL